LREILAEYVRGKGFELLEADRREKALEQVRGTTPDIVLLDISMPGLGGLETLRRIRATSSATRAGMVIVNSDAKMA
jgi:CheY-like chemotaxis protein